MPSPFPGMDPWLEGGLWPDVHATVLPLIRAALMQVLPERYSALIGQYVWLEGSDDEDRIPLGVPDIFVPETGLAATPRTRRAPARVVAPVVTALPAVRRTGHRYIRITDRDRRRLVTVVELISPTNKDSGKNRPKYLEKRNEYLATGVNLVEIDLLRAGERLPLGEPAPTPADYFIVVLRSAKFPRAELWPVSVRDSLPPLVVPLAAADADITIDLKPCLDQAYDTARYERHVRYDAPADPPLTPADAEWAAELLKKHARKRK